MTITKYSQNEKHLVLTREQVRAFDSWAINTIGVPGVVLMENAGRSCAGIIRDVLQKTRKPKVCIFCGAGNNGGDGYVIARHLLNSGFKVNVLLCTDPEKIKGDARTNLDILHRLGQQTQVLKPENFNLEDPVRNIARDADIIVDAIFGTGLRGRVKCPYDKLIDNINALDRPILAVDIPSGMDCDSGKPLGTAIQARYTVTFAAVKKGFTASIQASRYTGELFIASIGVEP